MILKNGNVSDEIVIEKLGRLAQSYHDVEMRETSVEYGREV